MCVFSLLLMILGTRNDDYSHTTSVQLQHRVCKYVVISNKMYLKVHLACTKYSKTALIALGCGSQNKLNRSLNL